MKKKFLLGLLFAAASLGILFWLQISSGQAVPVSNDSSDIFYRQNANRSIEIYSEAMDSFQYNAGNTDDTGQTTYSEIFAGVFIDEQGYLNIGLTSGFEKTDSMQCRQDYGGQVIYIQQEFSYNYLQQIKEAVGSIMLEYNVLGAGIRESQNQVDVYINNNYDIGRIVSHLQQEELYEERALNFIVDAGENAVANSSAYAGDKITGNVWGTVCVNAIDNQTGKTGLITNRHVALDDVKYVEGEKVGTSTKWQRSGTIDAAFVPFENQNSWSATPHAKYYYDTYKNIRLGDESMIISGQPVVKIGQTTGVTRGNIEYRHLDAPINYGNDNSPDRQIIYNSFRYSNQSLKGDSGGPVYFDDGQGNYFLIGMHYAGASDPDLETYGIACRITEVMSILDITPITNDSYNVTNLSDNSARIDGMNFDPSGGLAVPDMIGGRQITGFGNSAFAGKTNLTNIIIPETVTSIGSSAFENCTGLGSLGYTLLLPQGLTSIGSQAFSGCRRLKIVIPETVESIAANAFAGCTDLSLRWDYSVGKTAAQLNLTRVLTQVNIFSTQISASAFAGCVNLGGVFIPAGVTWIGSNAFAGCSGLAEIKFGADSRLSGIGAGAFSRCSGLTSIELPNQIASIGTSAFAGCNGLTIFMSGSPPAVQSESFSSVKGIIVPDAVLSIYKSGWSGYSSKIYPSSGITGNFLILDSVLLLYFGRQEAVSIPESVTVIGKNAFRYSPGLTEISVPNSVTALGDYAFADCVRLKSIVYGRSVSDIGKGIIYGCTELESISADSGNVIFKSENNCLIRKSDNTLVLGCKTSSIPSYVTGIDSYAFAGCGELANIFIPGGVASIGEYAFWGCVNLKNISFGSASLLTLISSYAFYACGNLLSITIPDSVKYIERGAFANCSYLTSVYITGKLSESEVIELDTYASSVFSGCNYLDFIVVPDSATALHYKTDHFWSEHGSKVFVKNHDTDALNWVLITDADYEDPSLKGFLFFYELTAVYANVMEVSHEYIAQIVIDNLYAGLIFYAKTPGLLASVMSIDIAIMCTAGEISTAIIVSENGIYSFPGAVVSRDMYSLGVNIATEYMEGAGKDYLRNVYEEAGLFPVIAPSFYNSVYFLMGMSEVFGFPVTVMSEMEQIEQAAYMFNGGLGFVFDNWLLIDTDILSDTYGYDSLDFFESMGPVLSNSYIFGRNAEYMQNVSGKSKNIYMYEYKISLLEEILLSLCNWYDWGDIPEHADWTFDAVSYWESMGYYPEDDSWYDDWWSFWESTGYNLDYDSWFSYWSSYWALAGYPVPGYDSWFDGWESQWEYHQVYLVEQVVIRLSH